MNKLSDFKLVELIVRKACRIKALPFKDVSLVFKSPIGLLDGGALHVGEAQIWGQTMYQIVQSYIDNDKKLLGNNLFDTKEEKNNFLLYVASTFKRCTKSDTSFDNGSNGFFTHRLYQRPLAWSLMKNIICPAFDCSLKNIKIVAGSHACLDVCLDVSKFIEKGEYSDTDEFVFVNESVCNNAIKNSLLLIEVIKAHGMSPSEVYSDIFSSDLYKRVIGALQLALIDEEYVEEFIAVTFDLLDLDMNNYPHVSDSSIKTAQAWDMPYRNGVHWWYFGLLEKMLAPARGADWSTRMALEPWVQDFWSDVEKIKSKKPQGEGVNFNDLLRLKHIQTGDLVDSSRTLQDLLSEQRVW